MAPGGGGPGRGERLACNLRWDRTRQIGPEEGREIADLSQRQARQHGHAARDQTAHEREDLLARGNVDAAGRFVEDEEVRFNGQSPGKRVAGLRVVREDGSPICFPDVALRTFLRPIDFLPFGYFAAIVFQGLYSADAITVLPQMITNVAAGDTYELSVLASSFLANGEFVSAGMQFSVQCNEEAPFTDEAAVADALARYPELGELFETSSNLGPRLASTCDVWGAGQAEPVENAAITSDIPTLVLAGEYDPITPPAWGELAAATLTQSTYVEFPGVGHGPSADQDCAQVVVRTFLAGDGRAYNVLLIVPDPADPVLVGNLRVGPAATIALCVALLLFAAVLVRQLFDPTSSTYSYLLIDPSTKHAVSTPVCRWRRRRKIGVNALSC